MRLTPEERKQTVERIVRLSAALHLSNGDSPDLCQSYREQLMIQLRSLAIPLWLDVPNDAESRRD